MRKAVLTLSRGFRLLSDRPSLAYAPFYAAILVIIGLAVFIGIFWVVNEYQTFQASIANIQQDYNELSRNRVSEELNNVADFIDNRRSQVALRTENQLREKVQSAYTIASHVFRMYSEEKSIAELRFMVAEILRPIRWSNGQGYYFAGRLEEDSIDLFAEDPFYEGRPLDSLMDASGRSIAQDLRKILKDNQAGIYQFRLVMDNYPERSFQTVIFLTYFKQFDWYIGAAVSTEAMEDALQSEILSIVQEMKFGENGYIFCFRADGTIISHRQENFIGRSVTDLVDGAGNPYGGTMLETTLKSPEGGFVYHVKHGQSKLSGIKGQRIAFVRSYPDWDWVLVADMSMDAMEKAIVNETQTYTAISFKNVFIFIALFSLAVLSLLGMAYYHSVKIKHGIDLFTNFFREAAGAKIKIRDRDMVFSEFEELARLANIMVDDRVEQERILRRDELRLDTLLQLCTMEQHETIDKYNFVLQRVIRITGSNGGYIALVNDACTEIMLTARMTGGNGQADTLSADDSAPLPTLESGCIGKCAETGKVIILNDPSETDKISLFPYDEPVHRRMEVPVYNNNRVVLVTGVCNGSKEYDHGDVRQVTMLMAGLWLHILKTCAEQELTRLERQVIAVSEEERGKIGRDLHDDLGSHLSGVELLSKVLQQNLEKEFSTQAGQLGVIRKLIREAIEKTRRLSRGLYPVHIIEHGLEAAIEELLAEVEQLYLVKTTFSFALHGEPFETNILPHLYYIIREAVFNSCRHGSASEIRVTVQQKAQKLFVRIIDNGKGFEEQDKKTGMGFHTMRYRAKAIGAELDIQPAENGGTIVTVSGDIFT